jgi:hypothetical protein
MVIPMFFYKDGLEMYAKCAIPQVLHQVIPLHVWSQTALGLDFDLASLQAINVSELNVIYHDIQMGELGYLSDLCAHKMWSE